MGSLRKRRKKERVQEKLGVYQDEYDAKPDWATSTALPQVVVEALYRVQAITPLTYNTYLKHARTISHDSIDPSVPNAFAYVAPPLTRMPCKTGVLVFRQ